MSSQVLKLWPVLIATTLLIACSSEKTATEYLASANSHLESGDIRAALIETRNSVSKAPDDRDARILLGELELQLGNPVAGEAGLLKALELGVPESDVAADLAQAYLLLGKLDELLSIETSALTNKDKARVLGLQAEAALLQSKLPTAGQFAKDSLNSDPVSAEGLTANARLQLLENNIPAARTYLSTALDNTPRHSLAWELLGDIETRDQRLPEALIAYSRAVESASNVLSPLFKRARTHLALKDIASASADVEIFEKNNVKSPIVNLLKSEILLREDKLAEAQIALEDALKYSPDYQPAVRTLAVTHMLRGNLGQAEQYSKQYLDATDSDDSRILLAAVRLQANRLEQAEQTLLPLTESGRLGILGAQVLATALLKQNKLDNAVDTMLRLHTELAFNNISQPTPLAMQSSPAAFMSSALLGNDSGSASNSDTQPYFSDQEVLFVNAIRALTEQDMAKALENAKALLKEQPENADVHTLIGRIHAAAGDTASATDSLNKARALAKTPSSAVIHAAMLEINSGKSGSARSMLENALGRADGTIRESILLGLAAVDATSGDEKGMLRRLEQARTENPASYQPSLALANYYAKSSDPEKVLESLSELTATSIQNPGVIELRTQAYIALDQFDKAIALVTPMVQSEPKTTRWRYLRAKAYAGKNDIDAVNRDLDVALRIDPDHAPSALAKANVSVLTDDLQQAEIQLTRLEALIPGSEALNQLSSKVETARQHNAQTQGAKVSNGPPDNTQQVMDAARELWVNGEQDKAVDTLTGWLDANPDDITIRLTLGNTYTALNKSADAIAAFQAVLQNDVDNVIAMNNLAWLLRKEDPDSALNHATRAVELQPDNSATLDTLAVIQFEQDMMNKAGETFKSIRALQPSDPTILYHGAQIQAALGEKQDAKNILEPLVTGNVDFPEAEAARTLYDEL